MKEFLLDFLFIITHPHYWVMLNRYDKRLDKFILDAIEKELFIEVPHTTYMKKITKFYKPYNIGVSGTDVEIWIRNYPHSYASIEGNLRPSRRTIKKLKKYLDQRPDLT